MTRKVEIADLVLGNEKRVDLKEIAEVAAGKTIGCPEKLGQQYRVTGVPYTGPLVKMYLDQGHTVRDYLLDKYGTTRRPIGYKG